MTTISYAVTVCDEIDELIKLISFLSDNKKESDEIVVQYDSSKVSDEVINYLNTLEHKVIGYPLGGNFANFKNNLSKICTKDYIFQLDADEVPNKLLMENLHDMVDESNVDLIYVPRVNTVDGITEEHIIKWKWRVNKDGWVNYPDYQSRIYKNTGEIRWAGKVHEQIVGFKTFSRLPAYEELSLYHHKQIDRQERQNNFYETL